ncbi:MAG TPA: hypothetical protein DEF51_51490 [Myxococcales bacterium]|nr:hypothetical protein [Myxococcales bacterium]
MAEPLRVYAICGSRTGAALFMALFAWATLHSLVWLWGALEFGRTVFTCVPVLWIATGLAWRYARREWILGRRGEARLFADRVEVPGFAGQAPMVFAYEGLELSLRQSRETRSIYGDWEVERLTLDGAEDARVLTSRMFEVPGDLGRLAADLQALRRGLPLPEHVDADPASARRDALDDQLDAELAD